MNKNKKILALVVFVVAIVVVGLFCFEYKTNDDSLWLNAYYHGDYKKAAELLKPLAEEGNPVAMYNLATLYQAGLGVEKNYKKAYNLYLQVAELKYPAALDQLGNTFRQGLGVKKNYKKAFEYYNSAIRIAQEKNQKQYEASAQSNLAAMYLSGLGIKKDYKKGFELLKKSADQGCITAQSNIAVIYFNGLYGVKANSNEAVKYITKAVNAGDTSAQCNLGLAYKNGLGVKKDLGKAYKWFYIAAHYNYEKAIQNIEILNSQISAGDKETAVQEAKEWIKTHKEMNMELTNAGLIKSVNKKEQFPENECKRGQTRFNSRKSNKVQCLKVNQFRPNFRHND